VRGCTETPSAGANRRQQDTAQIGPAPRESPYATLAGDSPAMPISMSVAPYPEYTDSNAAEDDRGVFRHAFAPHHRLHAIVAPSMRSASPSSNKCFTNVDIEDQYQYPVPRNRMVDRILRCPAR